MFLLMQTSELDFYGLGIDVEDSLLNYGVVVRPEKSDQYVCIYRNGDNYDYGFVNESELNDLVIGKGWAEPEAIDSFLRFCDKSLEDFLQLDFCQKLFALIKFFGVEDIMGTSYDPFSYKEAINLTKSL